jgi:hypothetical protein
MWARVRGAYVPDKRGGVARVWPHGMGGHPKTPRHDGGVAPPGLGE